MKKYEKPTMMLLSVSANDALCGTCSPGARMTEDQYLTWLGDMGLVSTDNLFLQNEGCQDPIDKYLVGGVQYCKFTGANQLFTS